MSDREQMKAGDGATSKAGTIGIWSSRMGVAS
jgi:hypothetical protein